MAKSKNYSGIIVLSLVIVAGAVGAWYYFSDRGEKDPEFSTTKVTRGDIIQAVTATGDLQPVVTVDVGAQVSGQVKEVLVDFNSKVKAGDVLARIDPSTAEQKLRQAQADLASATANNKLAKINAQRTRDLFQKNLVSQSDLDSAEVQLAQSDATLQTRTAAVTNASLDLEHCTITAPIDGMVLNRATDKGRTVNSSMNAPTLFTLVTDLTKMQINAAVAEADVGSVSEGQNVTFTVDAFPNATFRGTVRQVRNAATSSSSVISYATIIDVNNEEQKLKPGMTANVSIITAQKSNVLRVGNAALRARIPAELLPKTPEAQAAAKAGASASMSDQERFSALRTILTDAGIQRGAPATPEQTEKAKKAAQEKGISAEFVDQMIQRMAQAGSRGGQGGQGGPGGQGFGQGFSRRGQAGAERSGFSSAPIQRTVYKLLNPESKDPKEKKIEPVVIRVTSTTDGVNTEILDGVAEGDTLVTAVTVPGAAPVAQQPSSAQNPFQQQRGGFGGPGGMGGMGGGRR